MVLLSKAQKGIPVPPSTRSGVYMNYFLSYPIRPASRAYPSTLTVPASVDLRSSSRQLPISNTIPVKFLSYTVFQSFLLWYQSDDACALSAINGAFEYRHCALTLYLSPSTRPHRKKARTTADICHQWCFTYYPLISPCVSAVAISIG
jgi:hypothetical protein